MGFLEVLGLTLTFNLVSIQAYNCLRKLSCYD